MLPIHSAQTITYGKLARVPQALLLNFNVARLKDGLKSFVFPTKASDCMNEEDSH